MALSSGAETTEVAIGSSKERSNVTIQSTFQPPGTLDARIFKYGELPSLYYTLDDETVARVEEAALCCSLRDFESALAIFEALPIEVGSHPLVAYHHSQAYWLQWCHFKSANILWEALAEADAFAPRFKDTGVYTLLRVCYGIAKYYSDGDLSHARDAMREIKGWLSRIPIQEYMDVQVFNH